MLPVALNLHKRRVLIVGGGQVAARKATACLEAGAQITVITPNLIDNFPAPIEHETRLYQSGDCDGFDLVFAATDNRAVNAQIGEDARSNKIWCNIADDPQASDFHTQSVVRRGQIAIGVSTGSLSPVLARHLRRNIEAIVGPEYEDLIGLVGEIEIPPEKRGEFWRVLLKTDVLTCIQIGETETARDLVQFALETC